MSDAHEVAEDVFVGISHSVPVLKFFWKIGSKNILKSNLREILNEGKSELHSASEVLADPISKAVIGETLFKILTTEYQALHIEGKRHDSKVDSFKCFQVYKKLKYGFRVEKWTQMSRRHKHSVWTASDWARVRQALQEYNSSVEEHTTLVNDFDHDEGTSPTRRFLTLTVHAEESSESLDGDTETTDITDARPSDMDSIFGNPFLGYTVELELDDESNDSD